MCEGPAFRAAQCLVVPAPPVPAVPVPAVVLVVLLAASTASVVAVSATITTSGHRREHFCNSHCDPFPRWGTESPRRVPSSGYRCAPPRRFPACVNSQAMPRKAGVSEPWRCADNRPAGGQQQRHRPAGADHQGSRRRGSRRAGSALRRSGVAARTRSPPRRRAPPATPPRWFSSTTVAAWVGRAGCCVRSHPVHRPRPGSHHRVRCAELVAAVRSGGTGCAA